MVVSKTRITKNIQIKRNAMKLLWCWRCKIEVPMLDEEEYVKAKELYRKSMHGNNLQAGRLVRFKPLLDYYNKLTGWNETEPNAICIIELCNTARHVKTVESLTELHKQLFVLHVGTKEPNKELHAKVIVIIFYSCLE